MKKLIFIIIFIFTIMSCTQIEYADLVLKNGKICTVDKNFSIKEAIAVKKDKIIYVGNNKEVENYINESTKVIDLKNKFVLPGLIDAHGHLASYGATLEILDLNEAESFEAIVKMVKEKVKSTPPGKWIQGRGWNQNNWKKKVFPSHEALSKVAPDNPVYLKRTCGHAAIANQKAMEISKINKNTKDPSGGKIHKNAEGEPTGVFIDNAMELINDYIPKYNKEQLKKLLENAGKNCLALGLTGMHDAGIPISMIDPYKEVIDEGRLGIRVYAMLEDSIGGDTEKYLTENKLKNYKDFLSIRSVKLFADGALGSRGAALLEPYSDAPETKGLIISDEEHIYKVSKAALKTGFQVNIHAIGDHGNRICLNAFERALKDFPGIDHRFRIEHAQIVALKDIPRFNQLNIIPSMQPSSAVSDMPWAQDRLGEDRLKGAYAWRSFIDSGCILPLSSDFPVETNDPLVGIYAAVTCRKLNGEPENGWFPEQRITIEKAIKGFTIWAAQAAFQEDKLGSIEVGKLADFTIFDKDLLTIEPKYIIATKPEYTIVGGEIKYKRK